MAILILGPFTSEILICNLHSFKKGMIMHHARIQQSELYGMQLRARRNLD